MHAPHWVIATTFAVGLPAAVFAQDATNTAAQTTPATTQTTTTQTTTTNDTTSTHLINATQSRWLASGFVGSNFGASTDSASVDFGAQVGYLWNGVIGAEVLGDFAPKFKINNALFSDNPNVNAYMGNIIGAVPIGDEGQFQPYISGGLGAVQLRSDVFNVAGLASSGTVSANQTKFGGDIGGGIMGFAGNVGIRADVRYYRAFTTSNLSTTANTAADVFAQNLLSGLDFWRANVGLAVRW